MTEIYLGNIKGPKGEDGQDPDLNNFYTKDETDTKISIELNMYTLEEDFVAHKADYASLLAGGEVYTATLQNGWTSDRGLRYSKNKLNQLWIRGNVVAGTVNVGTVMTVLPSGYRPINAVLLPAWELNGTKWHIGIRFYSDGGIEIRNPAELPANAVLHINSLIQL